MAILSKSEILFLQGEKNVSKSYEYKLKSVIKKKMAKLIDKEIPFLSCLLQNSKAEPYQKLSSIAAFKAASTKPTMDKNI
jgi:hypothetical protein